MKAQKIPDIYLTVPVYYHYTATPAPEAAPVAAAPAAQPASTADTFLFARPRVRPMVMGNEMFFLPARASDEPSLVERLYNWIFGS